MASTTVIFGVLMILLGLVGYFATGRSSFTALIPAVFGLLFVMLGVVARNEAARRHAMHAAAALGMIGFLATARSFAALPAALSGGETLRGPGAVYSQAAFATLTGVFTVLCLKSFIDARRTRLKAGN